MTIVQMLKEKQQSIAGAESLTGGKFSDAMVSIPGASEVFKGSIVSYSTESKVNILGDRKSTRLNSSHVAISYAVFCLKKKKKTYNEYISGSTERSREDSRDDLECD